MNENIKSAFKEIEAIKKSRMEILDLKTQQKNLKIFLEGCKSRMEIMEERVCEPPDTSVEIIQSEPQRQDF